MKNTENKVEKWIFVTFGDGSNGFRESSTRISTQVLHNGAFSLVLTFDTKLLMSLSPRIDNDFYDKALRERGFGFWAWKPFLLESVYKEFLSPESEYSGVVYADAGCEVPTNLVSKWCFRKLFLATQFSPVIAAQTNHLESHFTKRIVFQALDPDLKHGQTLQLQAGWMALRKNPRAARFVEDWAYFAQFENGALINDEISGEFSCFKEPRNDQSIFSLLFKQYGFKAYNFPYYVKYGSIRNSIFPIWTSRNRSGKTVMKFFVNSNLTAMPAFLLHTLLELKANCIKISRVSSRSQIE
jgi:hypothetical protein